MASSLVANARTGSLRALMRRPALVNKWTLNGAGSGSSVGLFGVRAFTLSQQKRRAESRRSVRPLSHRCPNSGYDSTSLAKPGGRGPKAQIRQGADRDGAPDGLTGNVASLR